ncbi:glutamyl-tRNA reductase [Halonatronum saccharophilum]|uniref:glutamyl-tRNA reductase n=1 Tax=Halonatronum saccharophilum TaxID=150060 RepID=UPI0004833F24|nr:glutamyl-tRNA reductase [Halonatronum saccharophilum]
MKLIVIGTNHKVAPVQIREKLALTSKDKLRILERVKEEPRVEEGVVLSTCNRTELYLTGANEECLIDFALSIYNDISGFQDFKLREYIYVYQEDKGVEHLYLVASGLDSLVRCENQILGQLKSAFKLSKKLGVIGGLLHRVFTESFRVGKRVRNDSKINFRSTSISQVAVELAEERFGSLDGETVMILGAGETSELTLRSLVDKGVKGVVVANRTYEKGKELALEFGGEVIRWESLKDRIEDVDIIIASTAAPHYVLHYDQVKKIMESRNRPLFLIDIAVPRDIEPEIEDIDGVYLYNIDNLKKVVNSKLNKRNEGIEKIKAIIEEEVINFKTWIASQSATPLIKSLRGKGEEIREAELTRLFKQMGPLEDSEKELINNFSRRLVNKLLHSPTVGIKKLSAEKDSLDLVKKIFLKNR